MDCSVERHLVEQTKFKQTQVGTHADPGVPAPGVMRRVRRQRVAARLPFSHAVLVRGQRGLRAPPAERAGRHAALVDGRRLPLQPGQLVGHRYPVLAVPALWRHVRLGVSAGPRRVHLYTGRQRHSSVSQCRTIGEIVLGGPSSRAGRNLKGSQVFPPRF